MDKSIIHFNLRIPFYKYSYFVQFRGNPNEKNIIWDQWERKLMFYDVRNETVNQIEIDERKRHW